MSALDFREHLKTIFGLLLTSSELAALVNEFRVRKSGAHDRGEDTNDGFIDCAVFLNAFIKADASSFIYCFYL